MDALLRETLDGRLKADEMVSSEVAGLVQDSLNLLASPGEAPVFTTPSSRLTYLPFTSAARSSDTKACTASFTSTTDIPSRLANHFKLPLA